ncbi:aspartate aminotransferase family protein [Alienimonas californiensis]|uniref:Acetylornithine aminotransferase n=1 Tax=Alienimonas californiensis TaxID=2527989 RepID=A0A517PC60_9PLAN|nr:aspartate aminotransferase family protein [Alienimonas californiensis]QDT16946.1 Acetylornithine aminotransferase [Alienimonas californiensis]
MPALADPPTFRSSVETAALFERAVIPNYPRLPISLVRGEGSRVWDAEGRSYLDLFPGWGCNLLGYAPPRVVEAIREQAGRLIHVPNTWLIEEQAAFADFLTQRSFGKAFFCNSGAEATEAALKLARLHTPEEKYRVVTFEKGFHGRTFAAVTATAQPKYHAGLGPLMPGFRYAPLNDLDAVRELVDAETAAIMIEPVQGEGGVNVHPPGFLQGLRDICDEAGALLIFDEVQTGMGRTGHWFASETFGVRPDIFTLAKGVAGGVACGGIVCRDEIAPSLRPGMHASTFGGNPLAMAAGLATGRTIEEEGLLEHCLDMAERFRGALEPLIESNPIVEAVRVCGMMIGVQLTVPAGPVQDACLKRGLIINSTQGSVVRLLPALNVTAEDVDEGCAILIDCLSDAADLAADETGGGA